MRKNSIFIALLIILLSFVGYQMHSKHNLQHDYEVAVSNNKAFQVLLNDLSIAYQFLIEQLEYINDSCIQKLDSMRNELHIKDNKIKQMSKTKEKVYVHDTIKSNDTIFVDNFTDLDTCISDLWKNLCLSLHYPNIIATSLEMNLEQDCFLYTERQTIKPPRKTWIGRLFLKKHNVYKITVVEHNPYVTVQENKFIIIDGK